MKDTLSIDEVITRIRSLAREPDDGYILFPNPNYTPITDTLPDGRLVALDPESSVWATQDCHLFKRNERGEWMTVNVYYYPEFARKPNSHSQYPIINYTHGHYPYHAHSVVARAWIGPVPPGYQVDHIDGDRQNPNLFNLRIVKIAINHRDGGFLKKLRNQKIPPTYYSVPTLLRFFKRMALFKSTNTEAAYNNLSYRDLLRLLVGPELTVEDPAKRQDYEMTHHMEE